MMATTLKLPALAELEEEELSDVEAGTDTEAALTTVTAQLDRTAISDAHRQAKAALREAIKHGRCEPSRPSRSGQLRYKYTYKGMVYITDETKRTEITSWQMQDDIKAAESTTEKSFSIHVVFVVDHSGSMRKDDVPGYTSRTEAVFKCLSRDFLQPQLELIEQQDDLGNAVVSVIMMSTKPKLVIKRQPIDQDLAAKLDAMSFKRAQYHGNYLPALDMTKQLLMEDQQDDDSRVMVFWLSDGAESDHNERTCACGVQVWQEDKESLREYHGKPPLLSCGPFVKQCRRSIRENVQQECLDKVQELGDLIGRDRISFSTVAFGPAQENFELLARMAKVLPKGSFQKLGLSSHKLEQAFTSLTSTLTSTLISMRTIAMAKVLTPNNKKKADDRSDSASWDTFYFRDSTLTSKTLYNKGTVIFFDQARPGNAAGVTMKSTYFAQGAERSAFECYEVNDDGNKIGYKLVAKEYIHQELLDGDEFHTSMAKLQARAQALAKDFNVRVRKVVPDVDNQQAAAVNFIPCIVYEIFDEHDKYQYPDRKAWIFAEPFLDGKFRKWNNNAGKVYENSNKLPSISLHNGETMSLDDVPQAFSHFTYAATGFELVCDLQGVWNAVDGFELTDPVIHNASHGSDHDHDRRTDKKGQGIEDFKRTHQCSPLCRSLGLKGLACEIKRRTATDKAYNAKPKAKQRVNASEAKTKTKFDPKVKAEAQRKRARQRDIKARKAQPLLASAVHHAPNSRAAIKIAKAKDEAEQHALQERKTRAEKRAKNKLMKKAKHPQKTIRAEKRAKDKLMQKELDEKD
eukprot:TRINITY_DN12316_c0_g2_i1.p1 TRINITY_DN12316_c0_g2~~TRINITY_DN12316_c0_g2_i1.p1  ORF type:complete len:801 (+),score=186.42 TRINITY_DN12316_c0_g2_i1:149-2551(+)